MKGWNCQHIYQQSDNHTSKRLRNAGLSNLHNYSFIHFVFLQYSFQLWKVLFSQIVFAFVCPLCATSQLCHLVFRINNCVGEENHFAFMLLLLYAMLLSTYALILTFFHFWIWPKCSSCDKVSWRLWQPLTFVLAF